MHIIVNARLIFFLCSIMMTQMVVITIIIVVIDLNLEPVAKNVLNPFH